MTDMETLARLRRVEDRIEIGELIARYCFAIDDRDLETVASLFMPDGQFRSADGVMGAKGRAQICEQYRGRYSALGPGNHMTHDRVISFGSDLDQATGLVSAHAELVRNGVTMLVALRYEDTYRRYEGAWRFADRLLKFLYYMPVVEYAEGLGATDRMRAYGDRRPADYPETLPGWQAWK